MQSPIYVLIGLTILSVLLIAGWKVTPKSFLSRFLLIVVGAVGVGAVLFYAPLYTPDQAPSPAPFETESEEEAAADTDPDEETDPPADSVAGAEQVPEDTEPETEGAEPDEEADPPADSVAGAEQVVEDTEPDEEAQPAEADIPSTPASSPMESDPPGDRLSLRVMSLLLAMAIVTALSLGTSYSLYRWHKRLTANNQMFIPHHLLTHLDEMQQTNSDLTRTASASRSEMNDSITGLKKAFATLRSETNNSMADQRQILSTLAAGADQRERDIKRLKEGYDISILRQYFRQILSLEASLLSARDLPSSSEALDGIEQTLGAILDNYDIERFDPRIGSPVGEHGDKVAEGSRLVEICSPEQSAGTIAKVVESGFIALVGDAWTTIRPAKVEVYGARTNTEQQSDGDD